MFRHTNDLSALSIVGADGKSVSYRHVYNLAVARIVNGHSAGDALRAVYTSVSGKPALADTGRIHDHKHRVVVRTDEYAPLAEELLPRLQAICRTWSAVRMATAEYQIPIAGDDDWLEDVGYTPVSRANVSM